MYGTDQDRTVNPLCWYLSLYRLSYEGDLWTILFGLKQNKTCKTPTAKFMVQREIQTRPNLYEEGLKEIF